MTALIALVRKDLILFLSDRRALLLRLVMPIVLGAFFGYLFGGSGKGQTAKINVALVTLDHSAIAQKIGAGLKLDGTLQVQELTLAEAQDKVRKGTLNAAIVIPAGFGAAAGAALFGAHDKPEIPIYYDPSQNAVLAMVKGMLTLQVMQVVSAEVFGEASANSAASKTSGGLSMPFSTKEEAMSSGPKYNGYAHAFAGMAVQFILFMGIDAGIAILLARREGLWSRLLAAPITVTTVLAARTLSSALIAFGLLCAIFAAAAILFKVEIAGSVLGFVGVGACFALMTATFGLLIAAYGKTPESARSLAIFATLIMVMLGGAWVPAFMFPQWLQTATLVVPTRWAVDGFDAVTWRGLPLEAALPAIGMQLGFAVLFGGLALWKFRREGRASRAR